MRTFIFILTTTLLSFGLMSCEKDQLSITPSGHITTNTYTLASFDKLDVQDLFEVYVQFSPIGQGLVIEADDNLHHLVEINRRNGTLQIGLENNVEIHGRQPVLRAYVTTPDMNAIQASGACQVILENTWVGGNVDIELTGASTFDGTIEADHVDAYLSGACNMQLEGNAETFDFTADGASHMRDTDFTCEYLDATLTGASTMRLTVTKELEINATGGCTVFYQGTGIVTDQHLSGGSSIIKL